MKAEKGRNNHFDSVRAWVDECALNKEVSLSWFRLGFGASMGLNILLVIAVISLSSIKTLVPLLINHYENGITTVEPIKDDVAPNDEAQVESDIVRYVTNRESYDISSYRSQFDLVALLSSQNVANEYFRSQSKQVKDSPINKLGIEYERTVHVYAVNFLDRKALNKDEVKKDHNDLCEVTFKVTDRNKLTGRTSEIHYNALISWRYTGMPKSPRERWLNWSGYEVTRYTKQLRNI